MRLTVLAPLVVGVALLATPARADVRIAIANGHVTVSATDATAREILTEWARVGQTRIVNIERISGAVMSIELVNVPEAQALDTLLRAVGGYLAAPRAVAVANASLYDRIYVLATPGLAARPAGPTSVALTPPRFQQPQPGPAFVPPPQDPDDEPAQVAAPAPVATPGSANDVPRSPIFSTFPQGRPPQRGAPAPAQAAPPQPPADTPSVPVGVSRPGLIVPAPQPAGQDQPGAPRR